MSTDEARQVGLDPAGISSSRVMYDLLCDAERAAPPSWWNRVPSHWVMNLEWYKAVRRAFLPEDADDEARDESKWEPHPEDMVLFRYIVVTEDGGDPHLEERLK